MRFASQFILLLFAISTLQAQTAETEPAEAQLLARIPFRYFSGGVMVLKARLNEHPDSLNFILDTGSGGISLDSSTCDYFHLKSVKSDTIITGLGIARKVSFAYGQQLHLDDFSLPPLNFHINNYEVLSSVYGEKIDGIIGYSFLSRYIVQIDADSSLMYVYSPGTFNYPRKGQLLKPGFANLVIQSLQVRDIRPVDFNFFLDTGAGLCFLMSESFARDSSFLNPKRKRILTQGEGMGGRIRMSLTIVKQLKLGKYRFRNVPSYIFEDKYNVTAYPHVGGLLGNDILRRFNVVYNYPAREIHLKPNEHFFDPFDYAYTGMSLYQINGAIYVDDIIAGSPAEKAGLKEDDIVIGVGSNFSNNVMTYKTILQNSGVKIPIVIRRNGELFKLTIQPVSIF